MHYQTFYVCSLDSYKEYTYYLRTKNINSNNLILFLLKEIVPFCFSMNDVVKLLAKLQVNTHSGCHIKAQR